MPEAPITLQEMAQALHDRAEQIAVSNSIWQPRDRDPKAERLAQVFERAAHVFDVMATYEADSRAFITAKLKEHRG